MNDPATPGEQALHDFKKKEARVSLFVHGSMGAVIGAVLGLYLWFRWDFRLRFRMESFALDSWWALAAFVVGCALLCGAAGACLKARFWEDWRRPSWWW